MIENTSQRYLVERSRHPGDASVWGFGEPGHRISEFVSVNPDKINELRSSQISSLSQSPTLNLFKNIRGRLKELGTDDAKIAEKLLNYITFRTLRVPAFDQETGEKQNIEEVYAVIDKSVFEKKKGMTRAELLIALKTFAQMDVDKFILPEESKLGLLWERKNKTARITGGHYLVGFMTNGILTVESCPEELRRLLDRGDAEMIGCFNGAAAKRGISPGEVFTCRVNAQGQYIDQSSPDDLTVQGLRQLRDNFRGDSAQRFEALELPPAVRSPASLSSSFENLEDVLRALPDSVPMHIEEQVRQHPLDFVSADDETNASGQPTMIVLPGTNQRTVYNELCNRIPSSIGLRLADSEDIARNYNSDGHTPGAKSTESKPKLRIARPIQTT